MLTTTTSLNKTHIKLTLQIPLNPYLKYKSHQNKSKHLKLSPLLFLFKKTKPKKIYSQHLLYHHPTITYQHPIHFKHKNPRKKNLFYKKFIFLNKIIHKITLHILFLSPNIYNHFFFYILT